MASQGFEITVDNESWSKTTREYNAVLDYTLKEFLYEALSKTDLGEELGKPSHSVERNGRAMSTTVGSFFFC